MFPFFYLPFWEIFGFPPLERGQEGMGKIKCIYSELVYQFAGDSEL